MTSPRTLLIAADARMRTVAAVLDAEANSGAQCLPASHCAMLRNEAFEARAAAEIVARAARMLDAEDVAPQPARWWKPRPGLRLVKS